MPPQASPNSGPAVRTAPVAAGSVQSTVASEPRELPPRLRRRAASLAAVAAALVAAWLVVLPQAARTSAVQKAIRRNESLGVDPSAKFYSELPAMPEIWRRIKAINRIHATQRSTSAK